MPIPKETKKKSAGSGLIPEETKIKTMSIKQTTNHQLEDLFNEYRNRLEKSEREAEKYKDGYLKYESINRKLNQNLIQSLEYQKQLENELNNLNFKHNEIKNLNIKLMNENEDYKIQNQLITEKLRKIQDNLDIENNEESQKHSRKMMHIDKQSREIVSLLSVIYKTYLSSKGDFSQIQNFIEKAIIASDSIVRALKVCSTPTKMFVPCESLSPVKKAKPSINLSTIKFSKLDDSIRKLQNKLNNTSKFF